MSLRAAAALAVALLSVALLGGCAAIGEVFRGLPTADAAPRPAPKPAAPEPAASAPAVPSVLQGVDIVIDAPADLRDLLQRHLDIVRLGRLARDEVDETEWGRLIDATPSQVAELLQTEGYFTPKVALERAPGRAAGERDIVHLRIDPGTRARISRVTLEVEGELERASGAGDASAAATLGAWRSAFALREGGDFRNPAWADAKAAALARLRAAGYAMASWSGTGAEIDVEHNSVRLFLVADSGPLFRYGELQVEGLVVQDIDTVVNLAAARRGAPVTEALLLDWQDRLQKSGLFENVSVTLDTDPARAADARVTVRLREAPLQVYTFGLGISANTGPRASVEHTYRRVFGYAASARNKIEWGQKRQFWEGEISTHPGDGLFRNLIGGTVENLESDTDTVLSQRLRVGRTQDRPRVEQLFFVEAERSRRQTVTAEPTNAFALSLNYHGVRRQLDSVILPTFGYTFAGQLGIGRSHGTDATTGTFSRVYARLTAYLPLGSTWYSQTRLEAGQVFLQPGGVVPDSQKFRAGGDDSVRGYSYRSLGPLVDGVVGGGLVMYTASFELARPISTALPSLWGAVFVDAGNAANSFGNLHPALGTGVGVRWRSPVGPLRLDWAWARETKKARIHFSVGIAF
jgi:translocation and assembly module TamA